MHFSIDRTVHTTAFDKPVVDLYVYSIYVCINVCMHVHVCMYVCMYICMTICIVCMSGLTIHT